MDGRTKQTSIFIVSTQGHATPPQTLMQLYEEQSYQTSQVETTYSQSFNLAFICLIWQNEKKKNCFKAFYIYGVQRDV